MHHAHFREPREHPHEAELLDPSPRKLRSPTSVEVDALDLSDLARFEHLGRRLVGGKVDVEVARPYLHPVGAAGRHHGVGLLQRRRERLLAQDAPSRPPPRSRSPLRGWARPAGSARRCPRSPSSTSRGSPCSPARRTACRTPRGSPRRCRRLPRSACADRSGTPLRAAPPCALSRSSRPGTSPRFLPSCGPPRRRAMLRATSFLPPILYAVPTCAKGLSSAMLDAAFHIAPRRSILGPFPSTK